ncbi:MULTISPECIES: hypothetical protein [unclassified Saccharicrinis]|uniref:hypothetical protein n=1 Tax=unclassified Saccharicrinis TaxID=2646859 RepID=UPI003D356922
MDEINGAISLKRAKSIVSVFFILSLGYAVLRYHIMGPVPWKDFPFFIMNKAVALCAFMVLSFCFSLTPLYKLGVKINGSWMSARRELGALGGIFMFIHGLMSFLILNKATYNKFFEDNGTLTLFAGLSMFGGILLFALLFVYSLSFSVFLKNESSFVSFFKRRIFFLSLMVFSLLHLFFMGFKGWLRVDAWHGGLPPISLIGFVFLLLSVLLHVLPKNDAFSANTIK